MRLRDRVAASAVVAVLGLTAQAQTGAESALADGFPDRSMAHVRQLAGRGDRVAGSAGEARAFDYVKQQMEKAGLKVAMEPFRFRIFVLESATLAIGDRKADITRLCFDPYSQSGGLRGELAFIDPAAADAYTAPVDGKVVVTTDALNFYRLSIFRKPGAVVYLSSADYEQLKSLSGQSGEIAVRGKVEERQSSNLIASLAGPAGASRELILSAHIDSWKGPGAADNASGVAVLIELARHIARLRTPLPFRMRFIALGAEEVGFAGAKAYLAKHEEELRDCMLLFNIDSVGGAGGLVAETRGGVRGVPEKVRSQLPPDLTDKATNDIEARWLLLRPEQAVLYTTSSVPAWVSEAVIGAGKELGQEIGASANMGSDHRVFAQAGVPVTDIATMGGKSHTAEDVPESVHPPSLEKAARVVLSVVLNAAARTTP